MDAGHGHDEPMTLNPRHARLTTAREAFQGNPLLAGVAVIGFAVSFETISRLAVRLGMPGWPVLYPLGVDLMILAMIIESHKAIADRKTDIVPRVIAWLLSLATIYINAHGSPASDLTARVMHAVMPCLWIIGLEMSRWRVLRRERASLDDRIPRLRWLLSPWRTLAMRKRMTLHTIASYAIASRREEARLAGIGLARAAWGKNWRKDAPVLLAYHLTQGTLPVAVSAACEDGTGVAEAVEAWVTGAAEGRAKAVARTRAAEVVAAAPADVPAMTRRPAKRAKANGRGSREDQAQRRSGAKDMWRADPLMERKDVIAESGISPKTADRIKNELIAEGVKFPRQLRAVPA